MAPPNDDKGCVECSEIKRLKERVDKDMETDRELRAKDMELIQLKITAIAEDVKECADTMRGLNADLAGMNREVADQVREYTKLLEEQRGRLAHGADHFDRLDSGVKDIRKDVDDLKTYKDRREGGADSASRIFGIAGTGSGGVAVFWLVWKWIESKMSGG